MTGLVERLAAFATEQPTSMLAARIERDIRMRLRDLVGISLAAADSEPAVVVARLIDEHRGTPQAGLIGRRGRHPAALAALYNGTLAHALDFDDTHLPSVLHPSASVIPAALAVAEAAGVSGRAFIHAVAAGEEICIRLGVAAYDEGARDSVFFEKGLHATSICGTVGAAAAAGLLYGLDQRRLEHALAISTSLGAGLIEANRTGGSVKRVHCGWAAHAGIMAAELARAGLTGPPTAFEGRFGFFHALCDDRVDLNAVTRGLGEDWELLQLFYKPYPTNHFTQAGIDAALELRRRGIVPEQVAEVRLGVPKNVLRTIAEPAEQKARPPDGYTARFSGPFTFATALVGGGGLGVYLDDFTDADVRDQRRLALASRVLCEPDPQCDAIFPYQFPAIARLRTTQGEEIEVQVLKNRGGPGNPLSDEEVGLKFALNAERTLDADAVERLDEALSELAELESLDALVELTQPEAWSALGFDDPQ